MFKMGNITFLVVEDDPEILNRIYKLRYQIYVEEFGFERKEDHPNGYETDIYDSHSVHFAAINDDTGEVIATMRVILNSDVGLPVTNIEEVSFVGPKEILDKIVEVSRFAVDARYRRRKEDILFSGIDVDESEFDRRSSPRDTSDRRKRPVVVYGLFRLLYHTTKKMGLTHWSMISEKHLYNALSKMGFIFYPIGREGYYHGIRTPYLAFVDEMEEYWIKKRPDFILFLAQGLDEKYWPESVAFREIIRKMNLLKRPDSVNLYGPVIKKEA